MIKKTTGFIALIAIAIAICATARAYSADEKTETIVLAGGCFWGVQGVFQHTKGVTSAISGYAGGNADTAHYNMVSTGETGHAEAVEVTYNPKQITLDKLLDVYFSVAHNPTQLNYQGPDHGTQYRSAVFYNTQEQKKIVEEKIKAIDTKKEFATKLEPISKFYSAEDYHQNYLAQHPYQPYILINDAPKITALEKQFPELYIK